MAAGKGKRRFTIEAEALLGEKIEQMNAMNQLKQNLSPKNAIEEEESVDSASEAEEAPAGLVVPDT